MGSTNREAWLQQAVEVLRDGFFKPENIPIPVLKLSVGLPHARNQRETLIQYFGPEFNADQVGQIFVNPSVDTGEVALAQLFNCLNLQFAQGYGLALSGEVTAMVMEVLGAYPNAALKLPEIKHQTVRMIKCVCPRCGYTVRATQKWLSRGWPYCGADACSRHDSGHPRCVPEQETIPF